MIVTQPEIMTDFMGERSGYPRPGAIHFAANDPIHIFIIFVTWAPNRRDANKAGTDIIHHENIDSIVVYRPIMGQLLGLGRAPNIIFASGLCGGDIIVFNAPKA
jgi:hypothetical protein